MQPDYWHRQTSDKPLFPDLIWSRPENRSYAGKLLIIGGNAQGFAAAAEAYGYADKAGVGTAHVLLPDALQKTVGQLFPAAEFAPSTPSGSFAQKALGELLPVAQWADGVLLAGDLGRNSETAILIESFLGKYQGQVTLTRDAIEYVTSQPNLVADRVQTLLALSFSQLRKLAMELHFPIAFTTDMGMVRAVEALHELSSAFPFAVITRYADQFLVAADGQVSSTPCPADERLWRLRVASSASVWWLQNPSKTFESLTTSLVAK